MIEDITPEPPRMSAAESQFHTERQVPGNIRGVRSRTRPEFYKQSGMMGGGAKIATSTGNLEGYVPGASLGGGGNALFDHAYSGSHHYPGAMSMNYSSSGVTGGAGDMYSPALQGDYGTFTQHVLENSPELPALTEHYSSTPTCVDIANHITDCPVCSQLYSQDNTLLYVIIGVLVLIIILMFVKLLDYR